jgi:hypothetical protein
MARPLDDLMAETEAAEKARRIRTSKKKEALNLKVIEGGKTMYGSFATLLPLMVNPQPDTAEWVRLAVQSIPFGLPEKKREEAECP